MVLGPLRSAIAAHPDSDICVCEDTMSTTVYNPFTFSEVSRIRAIGRRPPLDSSALARVKRDLFGPVDHEDSRKFVIRELAAQQALASGRWGFDFDREEPLKNGPGSERYFWEKVSEMEHIPRAYASHEFSVITSEILSSSSEDADVSAAAPTPPASPLEAASSTCPSTSSPQIESARPTIPVTKTSSFKRSSNLKTSMKRRRQEDAQQKKMTDFLRIRKSSSSLDGAKLRRLSDPVTSQSSLQSSRS